MFRLAMLSPDSSLDAYLALMGFEECKARVAGNLIIELFL